MAFLDETGLAELWSLISSVDDVLAADITQRAKFESGSYSGTSTHEKKFTFSFVPKFLIISMSYNGNGLIYNCQEMMIIPCGGLTSDYTTGCPAIYTGASNGGTTLQVVSGTTTKVKLSGTTVTIADSGSREGDTKNCMNYNNTYNKYHYIAIG